MVIPSIPNTGHYSFITDLIRGRWDYVPVGLLCITHLRFFTRRSIEDLFKKSGYSVITISPQGWPVHLKAEITEMLSKYINIGNIEEDIFTPGFYVDARPAFDPDA